MTPDRRESVEARIVYWGIPGAGKTTNLRTIHSKLRSDNRGELQAVPTRLDPTVSYERLPIELGDVRGQKTRLQVVAVPGAPEQAPTRKQLLDRVDGVVLVIDSQSDRADENLASFAELRQALSDYGRTLDDVPIVVQLNKHDLADASSLDALHRKLDLTGAAVFETVATEPGGPLRTLTTISKRVLHVLRERARTEPSAPEAPAAPPVPRRSRSEAPAAAPPRPARPARPPAPPPDPRATTRLMEEAILAEPDTPDDMETVLEAQSALDRPWSEIEEEAKAGTGLQLGPDLRIVSVGAATVVDVRSVRVPLVLGNAEGETVSLALTVQLDPLLEEYDP